MNIKEYILNEKIEEFEKGDAMMFEWECLKCGFDNKTEYPYGGDVICEKCGTIHKTELEEDWDNVYMWVTNIKDMNK